MTTKHCIVVSAENSAYMGWQCKVFYFSCVTRLSHQPLFIVHDSGASLHPDFIDLARAGATIRTAPSYATNAHGHYFGRNAVGTLLHAASLCEPGKFLVLCEPDLVFIREPEFPEALSASEYLNVDWNEPKVARAAKRLGVALPMGARKQQLRCGVPYVIPAQQARQLAEMWLEAVDAFIPPEWMNVMYGFGLTLLKLQLPLVLTDFVDGNYQSGEACTREIIHYGWSDSRWDKRNYYYADQVARVWDCPSDTESGTIAHQLFSQIRQARDFYRRSF